MKMMVKDTAFGSLWPGCGHPSESIGGAAASSVGPTAWQPQLSDEFGRCCPVGCGDGFHSQCCFAQLPQAAVALDLK